ncbi:MAG: proton-conducting transporter membrane subunit [Pseudomonadota bacterium]
MDLFFLSLVIIILGGALPLSIGTRFAAMKTAAVAGIGAGCLLGCIDSGFKLSQAARFSASFHYLKTFSLLFQMDSLSAFFLVIIFAISFVAAVYSYHYMNNPEKSFRTSVNYFFFSLLIVSMALVVTAGNMIAFMLSWEIMSLSSFFLVIYNYQTAENRRAGYLYLVFSHIGAMSILTAFGILYGYTGSFGFAGAESITDTGKILIFIFAFIGFGSKAGVFPFHVWLPHAHPAAPSHISAVMSGVMIKVGVYGILRIYSILHFHTLLFGEIVLIAGMVSGILGVVYALGQSDLKRLLAYSSVENMGIILIGIGIGMIGVSSNQPVMAVLGFAGGLLHVMNHSIFKSLLFLGAGIVLQKTGTRSIEALGGLFKKMKISGAVFLIGSLAICGLPPFNGFVGEFLIYLGGFKGVSLEKTSFALSLLGIVSLAVIGGLALACFSRVVGIVFQGEPRSPAAVDRDEKGPTMLISMLVPAAFCILIGVFPQVFIRSAVKAVSSLELGYGRIPLEPFMEMTGNITRAAMLFFAVLFLILALRTFLYRNKPVSRSGTWGCGFTQPTVKMQYTGSSYAASILDFFRPVAPRLEDHPLIRGRFPQKTHYRSSIHDIAELHMGNLIIRPILFLFERLHWIQHGDIHLYIGYILLAIIVLLFFV